jgi:hypothetical protein
MPPPCCASPAPARAGPLAPSAWERAAPAGLHRVHARARLHLASAAHAPLARASDALLDQATCRVTVLLVWPFAESLRLLRPLLTSRSGWHRCPFRHKTRSPQVRTRSFPAPPPHLRCLASTTRALQLLACSPCSASPHMRFVFLDSRFRSTLPPHVRSPSRSCVSLRLLWSTHGRTCTSKIAPMLGAQENGPPRRAVGCSGWPIR